MNFHNYKVSLFTILVFTFLFISCEDDRFRIDFSEVPDPFSITGAEKVTTQTGLIYYVIEEGVCPSDDEKLCTVNIRDQIRFYYTVRVKDNPDEILFSSYANGNTSPSTSFVNTPSISALRLDGFNQGVIGMKEGEKRVLILPPDLAYGNNPNSSFTNDTLWVDVELEEIVL